MIGPTGDPAVSAIYKIECDPNGRIYVGSAVNVAARWKEHRRLLSKGDHTNPKLQNAWNKYGEEQFAFGVLESVENKVDLLCVEQKWIDRLAACDADYGFNISPTAGSSLGLKRSEETKAKISAAKTGIKQSPETIAKRMVGLRGKKRSPEAIAKSAAASIGNQWNLGRKHPPEFGAKQSARLKGIKFSPERIAKLSAGQRRRVAREKANGGRRMSEAAIENMKAGWIKRRQSPSYKPPGRPRKDVPFPGVTVKSNRDLTE